MHPVFHVSFLKKYFESTQGEVRAKIKLMFGYEVWGKSLRCIKAILNAKVNKKHGYLYKVVFEGYSNKEHM